MKQMKTNCTGMDAELAGLLLDPPAAPAKVQLHVAQCVQCQAQLDELQATIDRLDAWKAPEPSPYFLTRLGAKMREERQAVPAGFLAAAIARLRAGLTYGTRLQVRPLAAMALTVMLLVGGGAYLGITNWTQPPQTDKNAFVVHDLQILDNNAQVLDQMESLSGNESGD